MKITYTPIIMLAASCPLLYAQHDTEGYRIYSWDGNWTLSAGWLDGGVPGPDEDVLFPDAPDKENRNSGNFSVRDGLWLDERDDRVVRSVGGGANIHFRNFTVDSDTGLLMLRNNDTATNGQLIDFSTQESLTILSGGLGFGLNNTTSSINTTVYQVVIGGSTVIHTGGAVYLNRKAGLKGPEGEEVEGVFDFGDVQMQGGTFSVLSGSGNSGSANGTVNTVLIRSLSGSSGSITSTSTNSGLAEGILRIYGSDQTVYGGTISAGSGASNRIHLIMAGTGRLELTATNDYSGQTVIESGTLVLSGNGSINESSEIRIEGGGFIHNSSVAVAPEIIWEGGTVGGNGLISGNLTASGTAGKFLSPGNSNGQLTISGDVELDGNTTLQINLSGPVAGVSYDQLLVGGLLTLNGAALELTLDFNPDLWSTFDIAGFNSLDGTFAGLNQGDTFWVNGSQFQIDYAAESIVLTAIPEPASAAALIGALAALMLLRRRAP